ncbi:helix-turn-helix domain-containing protein [Flavobacterium humi]|uniref:XRE family transcriptional regulator n=1 Tax=Flavobacterium humi TaxID=2562683 RepID=A0A4Z0LC88_9FLAO|nr:helix-turn-helix transcriptional regulator [Flavobacterium humi]TGD59487.1 XRE family transcriptional regulator [Flavobacterium humi]
MKDDSIRKLLGFPQEEISMLLGVTRSQLAMYEIGQRDLPLDAKKKLTTILSHLQSTKEDSKVKKQFLASEKQKTQQWLEKQRLEIEYKKQLLARKKENIENKRAACFTALEVVAFLETQPSNASTPLLEGMKEKIHRTLEKHSLQQLESLRMEEEYFKVLGGRSL